MGERWAHMLGKQCAHSEQTVGARVRAERNSINAYEQWANAERKVNGERYVNAMWTQDDRTIYSDVSGVIVTLYFVDNQEKITNKLCVCINIILHTYKIILVVIS